MNPFKEKPMDAEKALQNWKQMYPKAYHKQETDPYTKTRIILMNGTEYESNWFSHQFSRHTDNNDLRRDLALARMQEKQQQLKISLLKPEDESVLEQTIGYEQLAVDLTAELAKRQKDCNVKTALDFALLEDFDHLYRYSDLLEMEQGVHAERLVGGYTEIMPGRPTIAHHRYPMDNIKYKINAKKSDVETVLSTMIITAAEQQTMNYYMNLYWSCYMTETDAQIKKFWEENLGFEIAHLHKAAQLLQKYEKRDWQEVIPDGKFPEPLSLHENVEYVRKILADTVQYTSKREEYVDVKDLPKNADFFRYQDLINPTPQHTPSHQVIAEYVKKKEKDYRYEVAENPIQALRDRKKDNVRVGREPGEAECVGFSCS